MKNERWLRKLIALGVGTACSKLAVFLLMPLYTSALSPAEFGTVDILVSTAVLLLPLCTLYAPESVFRFCVGGEEEGRVLAVGRWLLRRGSVMLPVALSLLCAFDVLRPFWLHLLLYVTAATLQSYASHILRARGQYGFFAVQQIFCTLLTAMLAFLFLSVWHLGIGGYLAAVYVADAITATVLQLYLHPTATKACDPILRRKMLRYGLPLVPTATLWWVISALDRYVLLGFHGRAAVGLYATAYKLPALMSTAAGIFLEVWHYAALRTKEEERTDAFSNAYRLFFTILLVLALGIILGGRILQRGLTAAEFDGALRYLPFLTVAALFLSLSSFLGSVYAVQLRSGATLFTAALGAGVHAVGCFLLIPRLGAWGAVVATALSYFAVFLRRAMDCRRTMPFPICGGQMLLSVTALLAVSFLTVYGQITAAFLCAPLVVLPFWNEMLTILRFFGNCIKKFCEFVTKKRNILDKK